LIYSMSVSVDGFIADRALGSRVIYVRYRRAPGGASNGADQPLMPPSIDSLCEVTIALSSAAR
jgi:hypothetical protein